jgi:4-diphosphocytidyl-2-C-methyl-D-erythritol kinase
MPISVRSYSKINLGLAIGPTRPDGFHGLSTLYQTLALHDRITVEARVLAEGSASRVTLTTNHNAVPTDARNTVWKIVERALAALGIAAEVAVHIEKSLPVQGGMGAGSANAAAALIGLQRELGLELPPAQRLELAAAVGSDVPLFLVGGAVLGTGRGEQVLPLHDFARTPCVVAVPSVGVSTPLAFRDWDARHAHGGAGGLTAVSEPDTLNELSRVYSSLLGFDLGFESDAAPDTSGIAGGSEPALQAASQNEKQGSRSDLAEDPHQFLHALVRTGIENDFEEVVFPQYPLLRDIKRELMGVDSGGPALYAALSGSGSALFGLYRTPADAQAAQQRVQAFGCKALLTETLPRREYWQRMFAE